VTVVIAANQRYGVLQNELVRDGVKVIAGAAAALTSLADPSLDWVALARGYGVPGAAVRDGGALREALDASLAVAGPYLVEVLL
jgi:acetolactate synthase-1/2/3 large subunit